jgi:alkylation response protein AidB-like acyl-CoA dehydrogenase
VNELAGVGLGVARRALSTIIEVAKTKQRGYGRQTSLVDRAAFQLAIGEADLRLLAARALAFRTLEKAWDAVCRDQNLSAQLQVELRAMTTFVVDVARQVASIACRYGGGTAIQLD